MKAAVFLVLAAFFLSGCNTMEGLGKDLQNGGAALEKAAEKDKVAQKQ